MFVHQDAFYLKKPDEIITEIVNRIPKEDYAGRAL